MSRPSRGSGSARYHEPIFFIRLGSVSRANFLNGSYVVRAEPRTSRASARSSSKSNPIEPEPTLGCKIRTRA